MKLIIVFSNITLIKKIDKFSYKSKFSFLVKFLGDVDKFSDLKPGKKSRKDKKQRCMTVLQLYNKFLDKHFNKYYDLEKEAKENLDNKFNWTTKNKWTTSIFSWP